jgi:hypothetical protein
MNFLIYGDGDIFVSLQIPELNDTLSLPGQLAPPARLFGILFNGLVFLTARGESHGPEALAAGARDFETTAFDYNFGAGHQLLGYGEKNCSVQHISHFGTQSESQPLLVEAAAQSRAALSA